MLPPHLVDCCVFVITAFPTAAVAAAVTAAIAATTAATAVIATAAAAAAAASAVATTAMDGGLLLDCVCSQEISARTQRTMGKVGIVGKVFSRGGHLAHLINAKL